MAPQKGAYPNPPELGNALPALATGSGACGWSHGKVTAAYRGAGEAPGSFCFKVRVGGAAATAAPGNASRSKGSDSGLSFIGIKRSGQFASGRQLGFTRRLQIILLLSVTSHLSLFQKPKPTQHTPPQALSYLPNDAEELGHGQFLWDQELGLVQPGHTGGQRSLVGCSPWGR